MTDMMVKIFVIQNSLKFKNHETPNLNAEKEKRKKVQILDVLLTERSGVTHKFCSCLHHRMVPLYSCEGWESGSEDNDVLYKLSDSISLAKRTGYPRLLFVSAVDLTFTSPLPVLSEKDKT